MKGVNRIVVPIALLGGMYHRGPCRDSGVVLEDLMTSERLLKLCKAADTCLTESVTNM